MGTLNVEAEGGGAQSVPKDTTNRGGSHANSQGAESLEVAGGGPQSASGPSPSGGSPPDTSRGDRLEVTAVGGG